MTPVDDRTRPRRRHGIVRAVLACGLALGLGSVATMAQWSTGAEATPGSLTSAQLDLVANGHLAGKVNIDGTYAQANWTVEDFLPAEYTAVEITVSNTGDGQLPLDVRWDAYVEGALAPAFEFTFYDGGTPTNVGGPRTNVIWNTYRTGTCAGGTRIGSAWRHVGTGAANATTIVSNKLRLEVGQSHSYCVVIAIGGKPEIWNNTALLDKTGTVVFVLRGTQVGAP